jgi:hypothetical protein
MRLSKPCRKGKCEASTTGHGAEVTSEQIIDIQILLVLKALHDLFSQHISKPGEKKRGK